MIDPTLPLIDRHCNLDSSMRMEAILGLGCQHHIPLPPWDLERLRCHVQVTDRQPRIIACIITGRIP